MFFIFTLSVSHVGAAEPPGGSSGPLHSTQPPAASQSSWSLWFDVRPQRRVWMDGCRAEGGSGRWRFTACWCRSSKSLWYNEMVMQIESNSYLCMSCLNREIITMRTGGTSLRASHYIWREPSPLSNLGFKMFFISLIAVKRDSIKLTHGSVLFFF